MRKSVILAAILASAGLATPAIAHEKFVDTQAGKSVPVPKEQLMKPPAGAVHYLVISQSGKHGDMWRWTLPDGRIAYRHSQALRGWISETDQVVNLDENGMPVAVEIRGITPQGDAAETFILKDGKARWTSTSDNGEAEGKTGFYLPAGGIALGNQLLVDRLVEAGEKGVDLLPDGHATLTLGPTLAIQGPTGPKTIRLGLIRGILAAPYAIWLDEQNRYFGEADYLAYLPEGYDSVANLKAMIDAQEKVAAATVKNIAKQFLADGTNSPVLFDHVMLFDADKGAFVPHQSVLLKDGKIAEIGAAGSIKVSAGTRRIDGSGKSLVPGIWDSHMHIGGDFDVLANLAAGMTSFRSPGTTIDRAVDATARRKSGDLLMGEPFIQVIIDQKHPLAAQGSEIVSSEAETIAAVRKTKDAGLWGVKFYTSMNPAWIKPGADEAHRLGLHVSGHVPATMRPLDAVRAGYDEITHLNFILMQAMPQDVVDKSNTAARFEGPAKFAKDVDLNSAAMQSFIAELKQRGTYVDPTLVIFEGNFLSEGGTTLAAYKSYEGIISPVLDRSFRSGGYPLVPGYSRADYAKSYDKMVGLLTALHKAGVPIVAGTDGWGMEIFREIELYEIAGFTKAEALQSATIVPARLVGANKRTGSIAVGKEADVVLVDGDVSKDLGALRRSLVVVSDGYVMDADALRKAAGYTGRPK